MNKEELSKMKVSELKTIADEKNIDIKGLKKDEIIHLLTKEEEKEVRNPNENIRLALHPRSEVYLQYRSHNQRSAYHKELPSQTGSLPV